MAKLIFKKRIVPDAGRVLAELSSVEEVDNRFYDPNTQKPDMARRLQWNFEYVDKPGMQIILWSSFSLSTFKGKKSKALTITETLLARELSEKDKEDLNDTSSLVGKRCYLTVKHEKTEDGQTYAKVIDFESATDEDEVPR